MYSTHLLSLLILLFISSASATSTVAYPVRDQFPLIARVGKPYSWSISAATFATSDSASVTISTSSLPSWLTFSNYTFSGTPGVDDEGSISVTLEAGGARDSFSLCVTHFQPPTAHIPLAEQFNSSNPSMSSVFPLGGGSALKDDKPALRVPLHWSFSIGFAYATFVNDHDLFYYAQLANGSRLPDWLSFNSDAITFDGVARSPPLEEGEKVELVLIASDHAGYSAVRAHFDLFIQSHDLSISSALVLNVTEGEDFQIDVGQDDWFFEGVTVDNTTIRADNITSLSVDTSGANWISFDSGSLTLSGTAPPEGSFSVPMMLQAFNESLPINASVVLVPSYFTGAMLPGAFANPSTDFSLSLSPYLSSDTYFSGHDVSLSANTTASFLNLTTGNDGKYLLSGHVPSTPGASHFDVQFSAYDHSTHAPSHATLRVSLRTPNSDATARDALAQHRRLVLGLAIGLGGAAGLVLLAGALALVRKCCRVKDTACDPYSLDEKASGLSGPDMERDGYGWSEKAGLGLSEVSPAYRTSYPGVGIEYTPSLVPGSPAAKRTTKAAFFSNVKAAVRFRNFSGGNGAASTRKSAISKPVLMFTKESAESLRALRAAAGLDDATAAASYGYINSALDSMEAPPGDGISLGLSSGLGSSPTSTTGHSNETGKASVPRQRADFGPARTGDSLGAGSVLSMPRVRAPSASNRSHVRGRSTDTQATQSSGEREREVELAEAVIVTASRTTSLRSARSSALSYAPSAYTRESVHVGGSNQVARPRLVPFTSAREVPAPVPTLTSIAGPAGPREQRRVSQVAAVVSLEPAARSRVRAQEAEADAIMTDGIRYVRAFGDQNADLEPTRPPNLGKQSPASAPCRSNSKRSSRSTSRTEGLSPTQTQSTYVYPSPSQSIESGVAKRSGDGSSRGSKGSRGSLMMSRILVRTGEAFAFKYPIALSALSPASSTALSSAPSIERRLVARPLYGGPCLPSFLTHAVSAVTPSPSASNPGKKRRVRYEVEFWGTPSMRDIGEIVVGIFAEDDNGECVGRLVVEVVPRGT